MKKKVPSKWKVAVIGTLIFGSLSTSAFAESDYNSGGETRLEVSKIVDVHTIVPENYFIDLAGKFHSISDVKEAVGFNSVTSKSLISSGETNTSINVHSVDEYAALLFYFNDLSNDLSTEGVASENTSTTSQVQSPSFRTMASTYYFITHEKTWNDQGVSWMKAFVTAKYDNSTNKIIGDPTTDSGLYGFHPGNSWKHSSGSSTVTPNSLRTGGSAKIVGDLTLSIIFEGVGDITTKRLTCNMSF